MKKPPAKFPSGYGVREIQRRLFGGSTVVLAKTTCGRQVRIIGIKHKRDGTVLGRPLHCLPGEATRPEWREITDAWVSC